VRRLAAGGGMLAGAAGAARPRLGPGCARLSKCGPAYCRGAGSPGARAPSDGRDSLKAAGGILEGMDRRARGTLWSPARAGDLGDRPGHGVTAILRDGTSCPRADRRAGGGGSPVGFTGLAHTRGTSRTVAALARGRSTRIGGDITERGRVRIMPRRWRAGASAERSAPMTPTGWDGRGSLRMAVRAMREGPAGHGGQDLLTSWT